MTQIIIEHGCFGTYLFRIGRAPDPNCYHCLAASDSPEHTLLKCPAWIVERKTLRDVIGRRLSLQTIIEGAVSRRETWSIFSTFCNTVMRSKEEAQRLRQAQGPQGVRVDPG
ncbi:hypothetical protein X777_08147 [Ooceraea biroi]|uniref:Reverse transcriptase zinc-binding domain-containing protein n=1 Tax=Ooceraea biroi TaxID=2015173 RepID=A0A026WXY3_OOCBI|nr:hypothetical protein X777_08147 [Ooceraea biroi]